MLAGKHRRSSASRPFPFWLTLALLAAAALALNWCVQVLRKPAEIVGLLAPGSGSSPAATWAAYGSLFEENSTDLMTPELLAALAQAESGGNPAARTYWRWRWTRDPLRIFAPASSAVGLYQITDGTLDRCRGWCIRGGKAVRGGAWYDPRGCWFNVFYNRLVPAHSVELTSACLDSETRRTLSAGEPRKVPLAARQDLAALIHLCGPKAGSDYVSRGLRLKPGQRCGDHDPRLYLARVRVLKADFARIRGR